MGDHPIQPATGSTRGVPLSADRGSYQPGELIACKYELRRLLRSGGMGSVWVARHLMLDISIAIKLIRTDLPASELTQRFMTEARLAARLEHPGIVSVFDLGVTERGHPFIAMELLAGEDLRELIVRERRLDAVWCVQLLLPIAAALASAHDQGIVHRDLKPENVFVARTADRLQPKLIDFGIAKPTDCSEGHVAWAGSVEGSPDYMAPEQARGEPHLDHRVDVWAFCAVLYECITGEPPFSGTEDSVLADIVSKPVCPMSERGIFDLPLSAIIERGLEKDPDERWQDMRELGRALAQWLLTRWVDEDACGHSLRSTWLRHAGAAMLDNAASARNGVAARWSPSNQRPWSQPSASAAASSKSRAPHGRPRAAALVVTGAVLSAIGSALGLSWLDHAVVTARLDAGIRAVAAAGKQGESAVSGCPSGRGRCQKPPPPTKQAPVLAKTAPRASAATRQAPKASATRPLSPPRSRRRSLKEYDFGF